MDPKSVREALAQGHQGSEAERAERRIVTFYSCRGGVGRTMALCNVASYLASHLRLADRPAKDLLCLDLDFAASGVSAFLRPEPAPPTGGLAQLFLDFTAEFKEGGETQARGDWLAAALSPDGPYVYRASPGSNLCVLPTGTDFAQTADALAQERWSRFRPHLSGNVATMTGLQAAVRQILRARYAYTLIDCRAGGLSLEFALANALSDALVLFFRPNFTQLFGVKRALAAFLGDRQRKVTESDVPVLPVLSPRPAHTDPRIRHIRQFASQKMFRWLDPDAVEDNPSGPHPLPRYGELIELPFDNTVEVGESLLIPPGENLLESGGETAATVEPDFPGADDEAPLFLAYRRLAKTLQRANFHRDVAGAWMCEEEALSDTDVSLGFQYHFCALEAEPNRLKHWQRLWSQYGEEQTDDGEPTRHALRAFCARPWPKQEVPAAYVMSRVWLADFVYKADERTALRLLGEAWQAARRGRPDLLREVLQTLSRYLADHPTAEPAEPLPSRDLALNVRAAQVFGETPQLHTVFEQLCLLEKRYRTAPPQSEWMEAALCDQLRVAQDSSLRAVIFADLGNFYRQSLRLPEARWAYGAALGEKGCATVEASFVLDRLLRLLPITEWKEIAWPHRQDLPPKLTALLDPPVTVPDPWGHGRGDRSTGARIHRTLEFLRSRDTAGALAHSSESWGATTERLPLLALVLWLKGDRNAIPRAVVAEALDRWDGVPPHPRAVSSGVAYYLLAAWAGDPASVAAHAVTGLEKPNWPIGVFWYLFFAASGAGAADYRRRLRREVASTPLLAKWVVASEIFFLYRWVWKQQGSFAERADGLTEADIHAFEDELDFLEAQAQLPFPNKEAKVPEASFAGTALSSVLEQIAARWRRHIRSDLQKSDDAELLKEVLAEPPLQDSAGATAG